MYFFGIITTFLFGMLAITTVNAWPVGAPEMEMSMQNMQEIPQWHCLRYFKHDIHLIRRCRNYRVNMLRKNLD